MNAVRTFTLPCGEILKIYPDESPQNPRTEYDNACQMICFHKRYDLGDKHQYRFEDFNSWEEFEAQIKKDHDPVVMKTLYLYDHSGITIGTGSGYPFNDRWDSGRVGVVFVSRETALKEWGEAQHRKGKRSMSKVVELATKCLDAEVEVYDQYLRGDCYGYQLTKPKPVCAECGEQPEDEEIDSCWGFMGYDIRENGILEQLSLDRRTAVEAML
jgi:hypothetical protein